MTSEIKWPYCRPASLPSLDKEIEAQLGSLSLEQKIGQMIQPDIRYITPPQVSEYFIGSVLSGGGAAPGNCQQASVADWLALADELYEASLGTGVGVPLIWGIDAVHGHNNVRGATLFPHNIGLGAANSPRLIRDIAAATAAEVAATGIDWTFAPTLAVVRDDRWGRTYEAFGESPDLVSRFAASAIQGYQGEVGSKGFLVGGKVIATAKHFLGDGGTEDGIDQGDTNCDEQTLRDIHGRPYFDALQAGAQTVMVSFSSWNGLKMHGHDYLLKDVLKGQMGFDGFVVSDWNGHGQLEFCTNESGDVAINAGVDMLMAPEDWQALWHNTLDLVESGVITLSRIDDAVSRILRVKLRMGLSQKLRPSQRVDQDVIGRASHRELARRAARESAVLLKNQQGILPLAPGTRVLVTGPGADNLPMQLGGWSITWQGDNTDAEDFPGATSVFHAIKTAAEKTGGLARLASAQDMPQDYDVAIIVFGEQPYAEGPGDRLHLSFSRSDGAALSELRVLRDAGIPTIAIFLSGRPLWVNPELNAADAFIAAWLPGSQAGGLADLIFSDGEFDFTGKLPVSWPRHAFQTPLNVGDVDYDPLFPFGYGLCLEDIDPQWQTLAEEDVAGTKICGDHLSIFDRQPTPPFMMYTGEQGDWRQLVRRLPFESKDKVIAVSAVDWRKQEDARRISWSGASAGQFYFAAEEPVDARTNGPSKMHIHLALHQKPDGLVLLRQDSHYPRCAELDITDHLSELPLNEWQTLILDLSGFTDRSLDSQRMTSPFLLWSSGALELSLGEIRIAAGRQPESHDS